MGNSQSRAEKRRASAYAADSKDGATVTKPPVPVPAVDPTEGSKARAGCFKRSSGTAAQPRAEKPRRTNAKAANSSKGAPPVAPPVPAPAAAPAEPKKADDGCCTRGAAKEPRTPSSAKPRAPAPAAVQNTAAPPPGTLPKAVLAKIIHLMQPRDLFKGLALVDKFW